MLNVDISHHVNPIHEQLFFTDKRNIMCVGGRGSGKSYDTHRWLTLSALEFRSCLFPVIRSVKDTHRDSTFLKIKNFINDPIPDRKNVEKDINEAYAKNARRQIKMYESELEEIEMQAKRFRGLFRMPTGRSSLDIETVTGSKIVFRGLNEPEQIKGMENVRRALVEESQEITEDEYDVVALTVRSERGDKGHQIVQALNPISEHLWQKKYADNPPDDWLIIHSTYKDNVHVDENYVKTLERYKKTSPSTWRVVGLGLWGQLEDLVHPNWRQRALPDSWDYQFFGLDFGYTNPSACVRIVVKDGAVWWDEIAYQSGLANADFIDLIKEQLKLDEIEGAEKEFWFGDHDPERIDQFEKSGFNVWPADKCQGSVMSGINLIKHFQLYITPRSGNLKKEISTYSFAKNRKGETLDEPAKFDDHGMDAGRMGIYSFHRNVHPLFNAVGEKKQEEKPKILITGRRKTISPY